MQLQLRVWVLGLSVLAAGCAPVVVAGGGVASYLFAVGTVEEHVAVAPDVLYARAVEWATKYGKINYAKDEKRRVKLNYYSSTIWISVFPVTNPSHARIEIVARNKSMMTEKSLARTVFKYLIPDERFVLEKPKWYDAAGEDKPAQPSEHSTD